MGRATWVVPWLPAASGVQSGLCRGTLNGPRLEAMAGKTKGESQDEREQSLPILAMKLKLQEAVERERAEFLGRKRCEHQGEGQGWRNGHEPKTLRTTAGKVPLEVPQTRDTEEPFRSKLLAALKGRTGALD
jgi:transposase-like protein